MPHLIWGDKIIKRRFGTVPGDQFIDGILFAVGQKDRASLHAEGNDVARPVIFLIFACAFVFPNDVVIILIHGTASDDAGLSPSVHNLTINIEVWCFFSQQREISFQLLEIFQPFGIDLITMNISLFREINLRA